ncbi:hypothetical protein psal_cds_984 [Pandoravirus salinus]|uniref:DUF5902 domain-containing protein n=1 Tax=Pandoravirus salinus TaxID=1349410 RepID=S4W489_9VIRU|nr:hypothetical protein psal_cds_984 [Pandoravirus salinus]AGO85145.1 hypothetical protein psal_cds_984 [Pandoravirus salinus]
MQTPDGNNTCGLLNLPPELLVLVASTVAPADLVHFCVANSNLLSACATETVDWRTEAPEIDIVLPPRMSMRRFLSPLDVAWYRSAANVLRRKCVLSAILSTAGSTSGFGTLLSVPPSVRLVMPGADTYAASAESRRRDPLFPSLADMEAWAREQPRLTGFVYGNRQYVGDTYGKVVGPLGPRAAINRRPPVTFAVLSVLDTDHSDIMAVAHNQAFIDWTKRKINEALTDALDRLLKPQAGDGIERINLPKGPTAIDRETPETRGTKGPLDIRAKMAVLCEGVDLWGAYPNAEIYLVKTNLVWAVGVALLL